MAVEIVQPSSMKDRDVCGHFDDFFWYISPHLWTSLAADAGSSIAQEDLIGGQIEIIPGTTNNNEAAVATTNKPFIFSAGHPMFFEAFVQYTEQNTSAMNCCVGFSSVMNTANMLLDDGAGPATNFSGAIIYKVDGGTVWKCMSSNGTTQTSTTTAITAGTASAFTKMRIEIHDYTSTTCQVTYFVDDKQLRDSTYNLPIVHTVLYASAAQMQAGAYVKQGSTSADLLVVDYIAAYQAR